MLFNSFAFMIFLPIVFILYWILPYKFRWILLLAASYYFYMSWNAKYVFLILYTTLISYLSALLLEKTDNEKIKRGVLIGASILCLGVLFFFKYFNFVSKSMTDILNLFTIHVHPITLNLFLPVGISFYTFQTLSYIIDVYKEKVSAEWHFGYYAAYISFFPQLVAGPIERTDNLLPQIKEEHRFDYNQATYGLKLIAWGYFKKIAIADTLSRYVSTVYDVPEDYRGFALVLATIFFAFQIYCDFSGYSDIAIGTAKLFGINLTANFKSPYFSQSIKEFWSRWHISLSAWFRDYVYIPLGGNRVCKIKHVRNLVITFLLSGLWHGANWTFLVWGGIHGVAKVVENVIISKENQKSDGLIGWIRTIVIFVFCSFAWIFFVSSSIDDAIYVVEHLFSGLTSPIGYVYYFGLKKIGIWNIDLLFIVLSLLLLIIFDYTSLKKDVILLISSKRLIVRWIIYILFIIWIIVNIPANNSAEFIYFQF